MNIIVVGIIACEIGFWVVLGAGLLTRYVWGQRRVSTALLLAIPVLDLALLGLLTWDLLARDTTAGFAHGLGAIYFGFTIAFGPQIVQRVDAWCAFRFAGGPAPTTVPKSGIVRVRYEWAQWLRMLVCAALCGTVLGAIILLVDDGAQTAELRVWFLRIGLVTGVWLLGWPVWETVRHAAHTVKNAL